MSETIYTIPVNEIFEKVGGCPVCRMQSMLEERAVEYITGSAMMESDVRIRTNQIGFCHHHMEKLLNKQRVLQVGLILESRLKHIKREVFEKNTPLNYYNKRKNKINEILGSCYICEKIDWALSNMNNTIIGIWEKDEKFRMLFENQDHLCLSHYSSLMETAGKRLRKSHKSLYEISTKQTENYLNSLLEEQTHFTKMFDYNYSKKNKDWGESKTASKRISEFLENEI